MIMMVVPGGYDDDDVDEPYIDDIWFLKNIYNMASTCLCLKTELSVDFGWLHIIFLSWFELLQRWRIGDGEDLDAAAY